MDPSSVSALLGQSLSPEGGVRKPAESSLRQLEGQPGFAILLLRLLGPASPAEANVKVAAAIQFKNFIKRNWKQVRNCDRLVYLMD